MCEREHVHSKMTISVFFFFFGENDQKRIIKIICVNGHVERIESVYEQLASDKLLPRFACNS